MTFRKRVDPTPRSFWGQRIMRNQECCLPSRNSFQFFRQLLSAPSWEYRSPFSMHSVFQSLPVPSWLFLPHPLINLAHDFYCLQPLGLKPPGTGPSGMVDGIQGAPFICSTNISASYIQGTLLNSKTYKSRFLHSRY